MKQTRQEAASHAPPSQREEIRASLLDSFKSRFPFRGAHTLLAETETALLDPWQFLLDNEQPSAAWNDPKDGFCLVGYGELRPSALALVQSTEHVSQGAPLVFQALPFSSAPGERSEWDGWPSRRRYIPRVILFSHEGGPVRMRVGIEVTAQTTEKELESAVDQSLEYLEAAPDGLRALPDPLSPTNEGHSLEPYEGWMTRIQTIRSEIEEGRVDKIVAARGHRYLPDTGKQFCLHSTLLALRDNHPGCCIFFLPGPNGSAFVGATPETLVRVRGGELQTHAVAGTAPRGDTPARDAFLQRALATSPKDRKEQGMVVDAIRDSLKPFMETLTHEEEPDVLQLARVQHLVTPFQGKVREGVDTLDIVASLHPTPAVAGAPVSTALTWLKAHEPLARGWYAAPVGWTAVNQDATFRVAIRCARLDPNQAVAFAGAGIVAESDPDLEWRETTLKLGTIRHCLRQVGEAS